MKKMLSLVMAITMPVSVRLLWRDHFSGRAASLRCQHPRRQLQPGGIQHSADAESDLAYVQDQGTLYVGITNFAPMDYKEAGSDEWIGFDADMAKAFAESLGVNVEFRRSPGTIRSRSWTPRPLTVYGTA